MSALSILLWCIIPSITAAAGWYAGRKALRDQDTRAGKAGLDVEPAYAPIIKDPQAELSERLLRALNTDEVELHYQPKLNARTSSFSGTEALFRWERGKGAAFSTQEIINAAESTGAIRELTLWTFRRAISDQLQLIDNGIDLIIDINMSGRLLSDSEFTLQAIEIIKSAPGRIGIEITETAVIGNPKRALANLELYSAAGAPVAIDDYGAGLSSLRYLKKIPAQELKIDREYIKDLVHSHRDPMIVRSTIDLAHALDLKVTAEGVDCPMKLALLKVMGCDFLQGFHIARPMPLAGLIAFMNDIEMQKSIANPELSLLPSSRTGTSD
ncbi:MAG: EAL domain-containing protein [Pseudomonadota bacterium]